MPRIARRGSLVARVRSAALPLLSVAALTVWAAPAVASKPDQAIVLPGASSAEGIAAGHGTTFYAGDLLGGDIFRGDVRRGAAELFIDSPAGRMALGMAFDRRHGLLFVAGGFMGQAHVYDVATRTTVASYQLGVAGSSIINDVAITQRGAWFTDSVQARLYFVPVSPTGTLGPFSTLALSGPAADISGDFNLNGIQATPDGKTLIVAHSTNGQLYTVDPATGVSAAIAGVSVPNVDGIVLRGRRLWAVQNTDQVSRIRLSGDLSSGVVDKVITSDLFQTPSTAALFGSRLAVVNAKFDTGFPPTASQYEVVLVDK